MTWKRESFFIDQNRFLLFLLHEMESNSKYLVFPGAIMPLIDSSTFFESLGTYYVIWAHLRRVYQRHAIPILIQEIVVLKHRLS